MGIQDGSGAQSVTYATDPPREGDLELTLLGPGYGESIVLYLGNGEWAVVDSCLGPDEKPGALEYLERIGVDPAQDVRLIVATHWHDDHIRGMSYLVEQCPKAQFCCAGALCKKEFLTVIGALEGQHFSDTGSGLRELYHVFSRLKESKKKPVHALANRVIFRNPICTISSLSPSDGVFQQFLTSVGRLVPHQGQNKIRIQGHSPNEVAVALWIACGETSLLLGADLERRGWVTIVSDVTRPAGKASVFKIPHHGSGNAHETSVWKQMLEHKPFAVLTPWRRGSGVLPAQRDADRILQYTPEAWITHSVPSGQGSQRHKNKAVQKTLRECGVRSRRLEGDMDMVRLRRVIDLVDPWQVEIFGRADHLKAYVA